MQVCGECGREVMFIAVSRGGVAAVEPRALKFYTARGRVVEGWLPHECGGKEAADESRGEKGRGR